MIEREKGYYAYPFPNSHFVVFPPFSLPLPLVSFSLLCTLGGDSFFAVHKKSVSVHNIVKVNSVVYAVSREDDDDDGQVGGGYSRPNRERPAAYTHTLATSLLQLLMRYNIPSCPPFSFILLHTQVLRIRLSRESLFNMQTLLCTAKSE